MPGPGPALGARNQHVQRARRLVQSRRARASEGVLVLEGPVLLADALDAGTAVVEVLHDPRTDPDLLDRAATAGAVLRSVQPGVLDTVGDATTSQGVLAVAVAAAAQLADLDPAADLLVLAGVADPGNAGTLLRVAEAAGFGGVVVTTGSVDPWSPKVVRASAGSVLRVPVVPVPDAPSAVEALRAAGHRCVGTRAADALPYTEADLPPGVALVLGNETRGVAADLGARLDGWVRIPMAGRAESLNVAMAGTVLAFEVARRRSDS